jgi:hypothetical protein
MGRGFSRSNLQNMRKFYVLYSKRQTVSGKLTWSHYVELLNIEDSDARSFYEKESINSNWSVRDLQRQIETSLFERLLLSNGKTKLTLHKRYTKNLSKELLLVESNANDIKSKTFTIRSRQVMLDRLILCFN